MSYRSSPSFERGSLLPARPVPPVFRERAIERLIRWREMATFYEQADLLRQRDPAELERSRDFIEKTALRLHMGELE